MIEPDSILGEWQWVSKTGGIAGINEKPKDGEVIHLSFFSDSQYVIEKNDKMEKTGSYSLNPGESLILHDKVLLLKMDDETNQICKIKGDNLILTDDVFDGFTYEYIRISNPKQ